MHFEYQKFANPLFFSMPGLSTYLKRKWVLRVLPLLCTTKQHVQSNPKTWSDLPAEIRALIIDRMDTVTRCKYAQCSLLCEQEAKASKNYLHGIKLCRLEEGGNLELCISYRSDSFHDFWLKLTDSEDGTTTQVAYNCLKNLEQLDSPVVIKWRKTVSGKSEDYLYRIFSNYLEKYRHCIRSVFLDMRGVDYDKFTLTRLKNLEELCMDTEPGDDLEYLFEYEFVTRNQIMELRGLDMHNVDFAFEQLVDLKAMVAFATSLDLDEKQINTYLRMIKTGKINKNLSAFRIQLSSNEKIDVKNIMKGLGITDHFEYDKEQTWFKFKFPSDTRKKGKFLAIFRPRKTLEIEWRQDDN